MIAADHELPSEIILLDILSRLPVKSLARFRCVSKLWCEYIANDQYFKMYHGQRSQEEPLIMVTARNHQEGAFIGVCAIESSNKGSNILNAPLIESFKCKWKNNYAREYTHFILGSCNGLVYLMRSILEHPGCFIVVDPLTKEYYELPPTTNRFGAQGLGFDDSTKTFKMMYFDKIPMLHVFGTNSWRPISQVPPNIIRMFYYVSLTGAVSAGGGCLHWLANFNIHRPIDEDESKIISLDMKTEKFRLIDLPDRQGPVKIHDELVDLNGEVGCVYNSHEKHCFEVWVLKQKEWVIHCRIMIKPPLRVRSDCIRVLGCWNKDGDILMSTTYPSSKQWFIYTRNSGVLKEVKLTTKPDDIRSNHLCPSSLFSLHGIKAYSIKK